ncbi:MAG: mechanosensitive ion channel [Caldilineaceae bacterium SB0664_bin_27]|uniref:Mechanosensitive ion channel n=1 Tax=Caldilineaceae bacterium SB0664_bin_27 TaxID=2605260 RepID=A0A6B0YVR6_9CHLR|nr:mechanosensitive ion channel [Caldilineaceae bacterium SB0664_bin_27]
MGGIIRFLNTPLTTVQGSSLTPVDLLITVGIVLLFYILARLGARQFQNRLEDRLRLTATNRRLIRTTVFLSILFAGVYTSLSSLGINLSIFLVPLGALSIGLGLGLQSLASNYIAGLVLMTEGTIRDGDVIEVDGIRGTVQEMSLRTTVVKTFSNTEVIVPNSLMVSQRLDNWTKSDQILRIESQIGVAYGADIGAVHEILHSHITAHGAVLADPEPRTFLVEFADSSLLFRIQYWIDDPTQRLSSLSEILESIYHGLQERGISIPFPQRDVWLKGDPFGQDIRLAAEAESDS